MNKLEIAKAAAKFVVGSGSATIINAIIKNNVQPDNLYQQVTVTAGSIALGAMVADLASRYTGAQIEQLAAWYNEKSKTNA